MSEKLEEIENQKIEQRLTKLEVLMTDTREDLKEIKNKVSNEIPHQIEELKIE